MLYFFWRWLERCGINCLVGGCTVNVVGVCVGGEGSGGKGQIWVSSKGKDFWSSHDSKSLPLDFENSKHKVLNTWRLPNCVDCVPRRTVIF